jgi:regulator of protease activity HflC (stomatin/prohibitin superfamily)
MAITPPPPSRGSRPRQFDTPQLPKIPGRAVLFGLILLLPILGVCYWWFVQRVEVGPDQVLVLVRKVGRDLPEQAETQVVLYPALLQALGEPADSTKYKGIIYEPKPPTRYFYDPFFWERRTVKAPTIQEGEIGIKIRKYGRPLPAGKTVATEPDERGPLAEVLTPGRHYEINPLAYDVKSVKPVFIPEGNVGVQTLYSGEPPENPNRYVVEKGERGVQPDVLPPGMYYNNPYVRRIKLIDVRSHTIDLRDEEAIRFPSNDSFEILIEGTVEYAIRQDMAPYVMTAIGEHDDIKEKIILPNAKSLSRIEGSKLVAREFISGEARAAFQNRVFEGLREQCYTQGIEIRAVLFRRIEPPHAIADPISDRQVAEQQIRQYENEIKLADSQAKLVEQEEMQKQNQAIGQANREVVSVTKEAEQRKAVALTEANKRLEVAKLELEAAKETAAALTARGEAKAEVILLDYEAEAKPLRDAISAFGGGDAYAQYFFYQKLGPALKSVLASTEGPIADIFRAHSRTEGTAAGGAAAQPE